MASCRYASSDWPGAGAAFSASAAAGLSSEASFSSATHSGQKQSSTASAPARPGTVRVENLCCARREAMLFLQVLDRFTLPLCFRLLPELGFGVFDVLQLLDQILK